jgi:hypothetical protein
MHTGQMCIPQTLAQRPRVRRSTERLTNVNDFPSDRYVRAARKAVDLSQRQMALRAATAHHIVVTAESNPRLTRVADLARLLEAAGLRLVVVDDEGREFQPEPEQEAARKDRGGRRYPGHLDVRSGKEYWWGDGWPMFEGKTPEHTFDRNRGFRDWRRDRKKEQLARDKLRRDELGDLHSVESGALTEVVVADEQGESSIAGDAGVLPHPTDEAGVGTSGQQGSGDVGDGDAGRLPEQLQRTRDGERAGELGVDRQGMTGEDGNPHASS